MIQLRRTLGRARFPRASFKAFIEAAIRDIGSGVDPVYKHLEVYRGRDAWKVPSYEEFYDEVGRGYHALTVRLDWGHGGSIYLSFEDGRFTMTAEALARSTVEDFADFVQSHLPNAEIEVPQREPLRVFIGHGRSTQWIDLKNHLTDIHHIDVEAYEVASRGGFTIREVLDSMLENSTLAFLVMTAEDLQAVGDGEQKVRARQNVVHEAGLFQGRLGFSRAVILRESGVEMASNLDGIQYIEFSPGRIRESFGDVLGVVSREFPDWRREAPS